MCNKCCKELRGWCKSFTVTEVILAVVEAVLLLVFIGFFIFIILHFLVCPKPDIPNKEVIIPTKEPENFTTPSLSTFYKASTTTLKKDGDSYSTPTTKVTTKRKTLPPDIQCTWTPSKKTKATTHYYEKLDSEATSMQATKPSKHQHSTTKLPKTLKPPQLTLGDESDVEEPNSIHKKFTVALVKMRPVQDILFGCILTIVSKYWTVTAASCLEAIEEVDSLDSFVMMEGYGEAAPGGTHVVSDVVIHPLYQGMNKSYDLAALRSETDLTARGGSAVEMPELIDFFLITIGESFNILGYGGFRTTDEGVRGRRLRAVRVYKLPARLCGGEGDGDGGGGGGWAERHLTRVGVARAGECGAGAGAVCAGPLHARGGACNYCAGTPLVRGRRLLAVMAAADHCAVSCEPALYVNVALLRDWLDTIIHAPV